MADIDYSALGQAIDSTWGRSSTPKTASYSVKFTLQGASMVASYQAIVNFGTEREMIDMKRLYESESNSVINESIKSVKSIYKELSGKSLKVKEINSVDSLEIIGFAVHNPRRTAYFRKKTVFEIG